MSDKAIRLPPAGAALLKVTVHVAAAPDATDVGLQANPLIRAGPAATVTEAVLELPFTLAVTVTAVLVVTVPAVAVKVAVRLPAATVTEVGTVRAELLSDTETLRAPEGAARVKVIVQVAVVPDTTEVGLQVSPLI